MYGEKSVVRQFLEIIEEKNERISRLEEINRDLGYKLNYVMKDYVYSGDGYFTFPDGDSYECKMEERNPPF